MAPNLEYGGGHIGFQLHFPCFLNRFLQAVCLDFNLPNHAEFQVAPWRCSSRIKEPCPLRNRGKSCFNTTHNNPWCRRSSLTIRRPAWPKTSPTKRIRKKQGLPWASKK